MTKRLIKLFALFLLALFFVPYIVKIKQWDLVILLIFGLALSAYDFLTADRDPDQP